MFSPFLRNKGLLLRAWETVVVFSIKNIENSYTLLEKEGNTTSKLEKSAA